MGRLACIAIALTLAVAGLAGPVEAQVEGGRFESSAWRIGISAPEGWQMSVQASYPHVLAWMFRASPSGKMLLTAERLTTVYSSVQYARRAIEQLSALGYRVESEPQLHAATGASWIEFRNDTTRFRQAFLVRADVAYALTLSATPEDLGQHLRAFDYALRSMETFERAPDQSEAPSEAAPAEGEQCSPAPQ
ncbi:hypothetical protein [Haliangium sp.]|uniref:hypothetical protein n=1 Tax=Haliangium sp. TaxID=2663208 RepID=UPI003D0D01C9